MASEPSILKSTKHALGVPDDLEAFDGPILGFINTSLETVNDLGVGEPDFEVEDASATWEQFLGEDLPKQKSVKTYVFLCVKTLWDPPTLPHLVASIAEEKTKLEWRINVRREEEVDA